MALIKANDEYLKSIKNTNMELSELTDMYNGNISVFDSLPTGTGSTVDVKKRLTKPNKYITQTRIYDENGNLLNTVDEYFISGHINAVNWGFNNNVPSWLTNPPDQALFDIFSSKAVDTRRPKPRQRNNDSELKYIFNFLEQHWNTGSEFRIAARSTLYTCTSCQGYLVYLQKLAKKHNKTIIFEVTAHPKAKSMGVTKKIIN